jgi:site-specific DNA-methyltransferase (adenine-specific)
MNDMKIEWRDISELTPYERNAEIHPDEQIDQIANSLEAFGWQQPVVIDKDGVIIVGHGRYLAAEKLTKQGKKKKYRWNDSKPFDWTKVPCKTADAMTEDEIKAYRLADNKLNESPWDRALRDSELEDISLNMEDFGFLDDVGEFGVTDILKMGLTATIIEIFVALCDTPFLYLSTKIKDRVEKQPA